MNILASPILWVFLGVFYLFTKGSSKSKGTDLSIFNLPKENTDGTNTVTTSNGTQVRGATITIARANSLAALLFDELDEYFTSEADILDILKGMNEKDFMLIFDQYGRRKQDLLFNTGSYLLGKDMNLIDWINQAVTSAPSRSKLNKQFPNIF